MALHEGQSQGESQRPGVLRIVQRTWLGVAVATFPVALYMSSGVLALYSARWLSGLSIALGFDMLLIVQFALGVAIWRLGKSRWATLLALAVGAGLAVGYGLVPVALPGIAWQWLYVIPVAALGVGLATTVVTVGLLALRKEW